MKKLLLILILICGITSTQQIFARSKLKVVSSDTIYSYLEVDKIPEPEEGMRELYTRWATGLKYPAKARREGIEGKVFIYFILDETGEIIETGLEKGLGYGCDEVTLEGFRKVNINWTPAY